MNTQFYLSLPVGGQKVQSLQRIDQSEFHLKRVLSLAVVEGYGTLPVFFTMATLQMGLHFLAPKNIYRLTK